MITLKIDAKFEGKLTCASKYDMRNFGNFLPEHVRKFKNWDFYWVLLSEVESE